jgi:hypothetical protein
MPKKPAPDKKTGARIALKTGSIPRQTYSRNSKTPQPINMLMARSTIVGRMTQRVSTQKSWTEWLRDLVPAELAEHIVHVVPREGELVVFADTSSWSARLRYALAGLFEPIQRRDPAIQRTQVRVQPPV